MLKSMTDYMNDRDSTLKKELSDIGIHGTDTKASFFDYTKLVDYVIYMQKSYNHDMERLAKVIEFQQKQIAELEKKIEDDGGYPEDEEEEDFYDDEDEFGK